MKLLQVTTSLLAFPFVWLQAEERPNIIVIMCDDMGYSDLGCFGSEIRTPNIDRLAANGLCFTQFYNCGRSCPTRASLMTGLYAPISSFPNFLQMPISPNRNIPFMNV